MSKLAEKINYWTAPYIWKKKSAPAIKTLWEEKKKPFWDDNPQFEDSRIAPGFIDANRKYDHVSFVKEVRRNLFIDPTSGFLIDEDGIIIEESIVFDHFGIYPDKMKFLKKKKINYLQETIIFDHFWSQSYFHFYSDVLPKLFIINDKFPSLKTLPLVVSKKISQSRTFRFFMQFEEIAGFNWYVQQDDELIATEKAFLLQPMPYELSNWQHFKALVSEFLKPFEPEKKIFINRPANTGRNIRNFDEIKPVLEDAGFIIAELEHKTVEEQIALFSSAGVVAGIHGAGMTNIQFCNKKCKILEIMPEDRVTSHYYWMSRILGLSYDCLLGSGLKRNRFFSPKGRFDLNPEKTKQYLKAICS